MIVRRVWKAMVPAMLLVFPVVLLGMAAGNADQGKAAFQKRCKMCHGADGKGNPAMARMLKVEFHAMDSEYVQKKSDEELKSIILKGKGKMAAVRGVAEPELNDILAYLRSLQKQ